MEDQVPFKVYTFWHEGEKPEVRRFGVDKNVVTNYNYLQAKTQEVFPKLKEKIFSISWKDEDGDDVKMSSDEEVMTMLAALRESMVKLYVHVEKNGVPDNGHIVVDVAFTTNPSMDAKASNSASGTHLGVCCDGCNRIVAGFRYKCITCEDFDLCSQCESQGVHPDHCVVRIPSPNMSLLVIKESIKKSRNFLKSVAVNLHEEQKKQRAAERKAGGLSGACPKACAMPPPHTYKPTESKHAAAKERREERREERQEKRQERREERQAERLEKRDSPRQRRAGWMDVFSKYVDQFANLAADHIRIGAATEGAEPAPFTHQEGDEMNASFDRTDLARLMNACLNIRETDECPLVVLNRELLKLGDKIPAELLNFAQATTSQESFTSPQKSSTPQENSSPLNASTSGEASQPATAPPAAASQTAAAPSATAFQPATTPTAVVSQSATAPPATISQPATVPPAAISQPTIAPPVAIFQPATAPSAAVSQPSTVIPRPTPQDQAPLPPTPAPAKTETTDPKADTNSDAGLTASAECENVSRDSSPDKNAEEWTMINKEKDMDSDNGNASTPGPFDDVPEDFQPLLGKSQGHLYPPLHTATAAPHIDAALRQMIAMGFTNEGGWLTQLLESKDGNIAAVLDLLTPVNPNKK